MDSITKAEDKPETNTQPTKKDCDTRNTKIKKIAGLIGIVLTCCFFVFIIGFGVGVYGFDLASKYENNKFVRKTLEYVPYPIAFVNFEMIPYSDYIITRDSVLNFYESQYGIDFNSEEGKQLKEQVDADIVDRVIDNKIVDVLANKHDVNVSRTEVNDEYQSVVDQSNGEDVGKLVADLYGISIRTFKNKILKESLLQSKLSEKVLTEYGYKEEARFNAQKVLDEIKAETISFEDAAKKYSNDPSSADAGGELGWVAKGLTVAEFENAAFDLEKGAMSDLVETEFGFHIIRVNDIKDGESGEERDVSHILIVTKTFQDWLSANKSDVKIWKLVK